MLEELGLGNDSTAIDLSLIPKLNLNDIVASFNSLVESFDVMQAGTSLAHGLLSTTDINAGVSQRLDYKISTDPDTKTINITIYDDVDRSTKSIYKALKKAKDSNKKAVFTEAEVKIVLEHINNLSGNGDSDRFSVGKFVFFIEFIVNEEPVTEQPKEEILPDEDAIDEPEERADMSLEIEYREAIRKEKADAETVRNTIDILHTAFSILKSLVGPLDTLIVLISNYQTNKEYVRHAHMENLVTCFLDAMKYLGLNNKTSADGKTPSEPRLYTVRTVGLYRHVTEKLNITMSGDVTSELLTYDEMTNINEWLKTNEPQASQINTEGYTKLFIDMDSILEEMRCLENLKQELESVFGPGSENLITDTSDCQKIDGTFDNIDKIEMCGDMIAYADSLLPRLPSQIDILLAQGYDLK